MTPASSVENPEAVAAHVAFEGTALERLVLGARALRQLLRKPDDTRQVFLIGLVANSRALPRYLTRISALAEGERLLQDRPSIDRSTVDWDALRAMPPGTLGGAYARHLDKNGLDPDLFQAPPGLPSPIAYIVKRIRQTHDILHVLTGYEPNIPGEVALQAFAYAQSQLLSAAFIATFGAMRFAFEDVRVIPMVIDGLRRGKRADFLITVRWEEHWDDALDDVRARFGIAPASVDPVRMKARRRATS